MHRHGSILTGASDARRVRVAAERQTRPSVREIRARRTFPSRGEGAGTGVVRCLRPPRPSARPRPLPAAPTPRPRRLRLRLAGARRADRSRDRAEDRPPRGEARGPGDARDGGGLAPAPRALRPRLRLRRRRGPRVHRIRVRPGQDAPGGDPPGRAERGGRRGGRRAGPRRARARAPARHRAPGRQAVERAPRGVRRGRRPCPRLRARAVRRRRHADRRRRRSRHARVHLARAARRSGRQRRERRLGRRRDALGGARGHPPVLGRSRCPRSRPRSRPARRRSPHGAATCRGACWQRSTARSRSIRAADRPRRSSRRSSARRSSPSRGRGSVARSVPRRAGRPARRRSRVRRRLRSRSRTGSHPRSWRRARRPSVARCCRSGRRSSSSLLSLAAGLATLRAPRLGLAIALAAPVFPLGNVAQAAAMVYGVLALGWLAVTWRDARAGLLFALGPLLALLGLLPLLPLAVQPARGAWRRGLQAGVGVLAAAAVAGLAGRPLPLTGAPVGDLGLAGSERPTDVVQALERVLTANTGRRDHRARACARRRSPPARGRAGRMGHRRARRAPARPRPALGAVHSGVRDGRRHVAPLRRAGRQAASGRGGSPRRQLDSIEGGSPAE